MACDVNVKTGRPMDLSPPKRRNPVLKAYLVFLAVLALAALGYTYREAGLERLYGLLGKGENAQEAEPSAVVGNSGERGGAVSAAARRLFKLAAPDVDSSASATHSPRSAQAPTRSAGREEAPRATPSAPPACERVEVPCPLCEGSGRLSRSDRELTTYRCPVCSGRGKRTLRVRSGFRTCRDCGGLGKTGRLDDLFRTKNVYVADRCPTCKGRGMVKE